MKFRYVFMSLFSGFLAAVYIYTLVCNPIDSVNTVSDYTVFASIYPVYDICQSIAKDVPGISVHQLLEPSDNSIENYSLSDRDYALLEGSDVAVFAGYGLEPFASEYSSEQTIIITADGVNPWSFMSIDYVIDFAEAICAGFITADESYSDRYISNLSSFKETARSIKAALPVINQSTAAVTHKAIVYLCDDLGIESSLLSDSDSITDSFFKSGCDFLLIDTATYRSYKSELDDNGIKFAIIDTGLAHSESTQPTSWLGIYEDNVGRILSVSSN